MNSYTPLLTAVALDKWAREDNYKICWFWRIIFTAAKLLPLTVGQERTRTWGSSQLRAMSSSPGELDSFKLKTTRILTWSARYLQYICAISTSKFQLPLICPVHLLSSPPPLILDPEVSDHPNTNCTWFENICRKRISLFGLNYLNTELFAPFILDQPACHLPALLL